MNVKEILSKINNSIKYIDFNASYNSGNTEKPYTAKNLTQLKDVVNELSDVDFIKDQIQALKATKLFENYKDEDIFTSSDHLKIQSIVNELKIGLKFLINYYYSTNNYTDEVIHIKFPEIENFDDLSKTSNELKRAIEIPINESNTSGNVAILTAEKGSIWLIVSLGVASAVNLVAAICWSAAVIRRKNAEAKIFEAHAKTLELKNDALDILVKAQKEQISNILTAESEAILSKYYDHNDPETLARLKLSVTTVADLIDRGAKILPNSEKDDIKKLFPDYNNLNLISSTIKQLTGEK